MSQRDSPDHGPPASSDLFDATVTGLVRNHGTTASAVARAPGRVNLIGEHTDYVGGLCLPIALAESTWVACGTPPGIRPGELRVTSGDAFAWQGSVHDRPQGWAAYVLGALQAVGHPGGLALHVESTVPLGAGLSSSAALICAVLRAASDALNVELVEPAIAAEVHHVGAPTGGMDQSIALLAEPGHALLLDFGARSRDLVPWTPERSGLELLVVDTGVRHDNAGGQFAVRRDEALAALDAALSRDTAVLARRRRHVHSENARVVDVVRALRAGDWEEVGRHFTASHVSLRDDYEVSCPELDLAVAAALGAGALGARMTGGGFGGCVIVLCAVDDRPGVEAATQRAFAARSWAVPTVRTAIASGPAVRLR